jgi:hypothetical protein
MTDELASVGNEIVLAKEVGGLEMGVLEDGTSYLTGRGLAKVCGVVHSAIQQHEALWHGGYRTSLLARKLLAKGMDKRERLYIEFDGPFGQAAHAFPDDVCMVFLEYYAFDARGEQNAVALDYFKRFAHAGMRLFVYGQTGYNPEALAAEKWTKFHDRLLANTAPAGYFSVFREMSETMVAAIKSGLPVDEHTVPDISVGKLWSMHWRASKHEAAFGPAQKYPHVYPPSYPQSRANDWIEANVYPLAALGVFRIWMQDVYLPQKFSAYLGRKAKDGVLTQGAVKKILAVFGMSASVQLGARKKRAG